jgi:hypothetical protein
MNKYDSYNYWRGMKPCARIRVQRVGISPTAVTLLRRQKTVKSE